MANDTVATLTWTVACVLLASHPFFNV